MSVLPIRILSVVLDTDSKHQDDHKTQVESGQKVGWM